MGQEPPHACLETQALSQTPRMTQENELTVLHLVTLQREIANQRLSHVRDLTEYQRLWRLSWATPYFTNDEIKAHRRMDY